MSAVFMICGLACLFLLFWTGAAFEDRQLVPTQSARRGTAFAALMIGAFAAVFLFSAGIAWVAP